MKKSLGKVFPYFKKTFSRLSRALFALKDGPTKEKSLSKAIEDLESIGEDMENAGADIGSTLMRAIESSRSMDEDEM